MKKILILAAVMISSLSFARDYEYGERALEENMKNAERISRLSPEEYSIVRDNNFEEYSEFHRELENMDRGTEVR